MLGEKRTTTRFMTKYERARVLGTRALQIRCALAAAAAGRVDEGGGARGAKEPRRRRRSAARTLDGWEERRAAYPAYTIHRLCAA